MSVRTTFDVFCDLCANWIEGAPEGGIRPSRQVAKAHHWAVRVKIKGGWGDICPECRRTIHLKKLRLDAEHCEESINLFYPGYIKWENGEIAFDEVTRKKIAKSFGVDLGLLPNPLRWVDKKQVDLFFERLES